jgi:DNA replication initiation complex subunit (GINS family)
MKANILRRRGWTFAIWQTLSDDEKDFYFADELFIEQQVAELRKSITYNPKEQNDSDEATDAGAQIALILAGLGF